MVAESRSVAALFVAAPCAPTLPLEGRRVLVVEDEALIAFDVKALLTEAGCTVVGPCPTANQAMALLERTQIDCATVDLGLAGGAGASVAYALERRGIPFVIVTGQPVESIPESLRGYLVVQKPFGESELLEAIMTNMTP